MHCDLFGRIGVAAADFDMDRWIRQRAGIA